MPPPLFFVRDFVCSCHYPKATIFRNCVTRCGLEFVQSDRNAALCAGLHIYVYCLF